MAEEAVDHTEGAASAGQTPQSEKRTHEQSTIQFPYCDLDDACSIATGIMKCGGLECAPDQLAAAVGQSPLSGNFRQKISAARLFGLVETIHGKYQLTELGHTIIDRDQGRARAARADAFLNVPLYRKVYDEFRNRPLPPRPAALELAFVRFGVAAKQKDRARLAFDRAAQQAGYFDQGGKDRLVRPAGIAPPPNADEAPEDSLRGGGGNGGNGGGSVGGGEQAVHGGGGGHGGGRRGAPSHAHPFIQGLLEHLPQPDTLWTIEGRAKWLKTAADVFDLMYKGDGEISIKVDRAEGGHQ
jgi:hypothetical protein